MRLPGFNAEFSLGKTRHRYHGRYLFADNTTGLPANVLSAQYEEAEYEEAGVEDPDADEIDEISDEEPEIEEEDEED